MAGYNNVTVNPILYSFLQQQQRSPLDRRAVASSLGWPRGLGYIGRLLEGGFYRLRKPLKEVNLEGTVRNREAHTHAAS
jgi:hypothetical protein